jgi:hypothetical protein
VVIPQVRSVLINILIILIGGPLAGAYFAWQTGELTSWSQFWPVIQHGSLASAMLAVGWLLMKSPYSARITELLNTSTTPSGATVTTAVKITEPVTAEPLKESQPGTGIKS